MTREETMKTGSTDVTLTTEGNRSQVLSLTSKKVRGRFYLVSKKIETNK